MSDLTSEIENSTSSGTEVGNAQLRCDANVTPIYPVRYAYANFFDELSSVSSPPAVSTFFNASNLPTTEGYVLRLLRPGWIYIKEETGKSLFHIFRYERTSNDTGGPVVERFSKYLYKNGVDASDGIEADTSSGRPFYPYVFVSKGTSEVSICYSEHEWGAEITSKFNTDAAFRSKVAQRVNLIAEETEYAISASQENLSALVEDYRSRKDRVLTLDPSKPEEKLGLDVLTIENSYDMSPGLIAQELSQKLCYGETAKIVALFDPVGRQKEIARAHAKLMLWEQDYASQHVYPFTIGQMAQVCLTSENEDLRDAAEKNLNLQEFNDQWVEMDAAFTKFKERRKAFLNLYLAFLMPGEGLVDQLGSLDSYFRYFFAGDSGDQEELRKVAVTAAGIFEGVLSSPEGNAALEGAMEHAFNSEQSTDWYNSQNTLGVILKMVTGLVTQPQANVSWDLVTTKALDDLMKGLGPLLGRIMADAQYGFAKSGHGFETLSQKTVKHIATKVIPAVLKAYGLEYTGQRLRLTPEEIAKVLADFLERGTWGKASVIRNAEARLQVGQRMFDWSQVAEGKTSARLLELDEMRIIRGGPLPIDLSVQPSTARFFGVTMNASFTGLSAFLNFSAVQSMMFQSEYAAANPLGVGGRKYEAMRLTAALAGLPADMIAMSEMGVKAAQRLSPQAIRTLAQRLVPNLGSRLTFFGRILAGKVSTGLIAIANLAGTLTAIQAGVREMNQGNTPAAVGNFMIATGSAILFVGAAGQLLSLAAGSAATGFGLPVAVVCAALALIVGGVGLLFFFEKTPMETLLFQCFWGKSKDYAFWPDGALRPKIEDRLTAVADPSRSAQMNTNFQIEMQEFMNLFAAPSMEFDRTGGSLLRKLTGQAFTNDRSYDIKMVLPQFQLGSSEIIAGVYTTAGFDPSGQIVTTPNATLTALFREKLRAAMETGGQYTLVEGTLSLSFSVDFGQRANIIWVYSPMPNIYTPLRMLRDDGSLRETGEFIGGMINDVPLGRV
ncbi:toxin VasX [Thioclava sp. GXIMD4215]|uniref:toxin VasX n=1 Tax=Thioclava sp. GXIMD4215 TaxID=3131928 RepID=UPI00311B430D